ncbi:hypothetical protein B0T17DRAFT_528601 [Bombardia bombarda]|uniref:Uncharacterized protein n=1 Tax=Bombardia bombarda TaxID=252184 RepID=A0AA39XAT2_9PEZI|nr:hypothetical protein B0T17DRAFT_528601 [Bombardia bombarda]
MHLTAPRIARKQLETLCLPGTSDNVGWKEPIQLGDKLVLAEVCRPLPGALS